jgi:hypothetical protein
MKKLNLFIAGLAFLSLFCLFSCNSGNSGNSEDSDTTIVKLEEKMDNLESDAADSSSVSNESKKLGKEYTARYICPDHCKGSGSDKQGVCPNCGMELIENQSYGEK